MGANMMTSNRVLLQKADLALSDLISNGGYLVDGQAKKFIRLLIKKSVVLGMATVKPMTSHTERMPKARFGGRVLHAAQSATPLSEANRSKLDTSKVTLSAKLFKASVHLDDETMEDNIEQGQFRSTVMDLLGEAISRDADNFVINSDTNSADPDLAQFDGMLVSATSNSVGGGTAALSKTQLKSAIKTMPTEFIDDKKKLRYLTSYDAETDARDSYTSRDTVAGDRYLTEDTPVLYGGIPLKGVPNFPENLGGGTNETNLILTDPKNICVGVWRKVKIQTDQDIEAGILKIVASMRFDFKYIHEPAVVKVTAITVS